ncbi:MAG: ABC transporter ATP-binding protein [candidate division NC10 bacterium]|nr:ABC transporter ATP-binding protein [candidate division NC10 bacterium]
MLKVHNIETFYGPIRAISGLSLEVPEGKIVALLGSNGAGKTTILKTICGLLEGQPSKGTIEFMGTPLNGLAPEGIVRLGIAYVEEGRPVFEELTVDENLLMGGYVRRDVHGLQRDRDRVMSYFPVLGQRRGQLAGTLSGGERQMLVIGRALMARPKLMLLDEPSLGLAPMAVKEIFQILKTINEEGTTILLVEQNAKMALEIAHEGHVIEAGRVVLSDQAKSLLENENVRCYYLGITGEVSASGLKRHRKKRWR